LINPVQIFAVGGGGFTHPEDNYPHDTILEDHLLALAGPIAKVRIGYIGHASNDNPTKIDTFYKRFDSCANITTLPLEANLAEARVFLNDLDILYVGGGATKKMLAHWQKIGICKILIEAAHGGLILSGVSAGAICWFSELLLGSAKEGFTLHKGLGLLAGSACPHFSNEPPRKRAFEQQIANGRLAAGLAIDDGVAIHICDGIVTNIVSARGALANAYFVSNNLNKVEVKPLDLGHQVI
jgi:dipeptidase E